MALKQVGPYRILSELGRGAFGAVFLAQREGLGRQVALKVLMPGADEIAQARFKQEAKLASKLEHAHIVRCCDLGRDAERGLLYLALDYVSGGSLKERLKLTGAMPPEEAARLVAQICQGLDYAHRSGILHRDLKPDNVLLEADGRALLTDFGLAKDLSVSGLTSEGLIVGTPNYFPPETLDGGPATPTSDVYGVGLLLYECLTAKRTFPGNDFYVVTSAIRTGNYRPLKAIAPHVPRDLARICQRACSLDPKSRFATAEDLQRALQTYLSAPSPDTDGGIPAYAGAKAGVPIWQLALLFGALFLLAGAGTAVVLVVLEGPASATQGADPAQSPKETPGETAPSPPRPSPLAVATPSPSPDSIAQDPLPVEGVTDAELERRANRGDVVAAEALAERALAVWAHERGREWASLAGSARPRLVDRIGRAEEEERALVKPLRSELHTKLSPRGILPRVQALLEAHPEAPQLRTCEGTLLLWLGQPRKALEALNRGAMGKHAVALRGAANENVGLQIPDTPSDAELHQDWDCYRGASWEWSPEDGVLEAKGSGLGPFGLSGLLERKGPRSGSFQASVEIQFDPKEPDRYGGLLVMKDARNGLLVYIYHGPESIPPQYQAQVAALGEGGATMLRVAYLLRGEWRPFTDDQVFPFNPKGWHQLQAKVVDGQLLEVSVDGQAATPIRLPVVAEGRVGVLKWYEHQLRYRNFASGP
jgi:protein kinase-like protein